MSLQKLLELTKRLNNDLPEVPIRARIIPYERLVQVVFILDSEIQSWFIIYNKDKLSVTEINSDLFDLSENYKETTLYNSTDEVFEEIKSQSLRILSLS